MKNSRLENAAAAAGFAMVNPDDFAREAPAIADDQPSSHHDEPVRPANKSWLIWDYLRLTTGAKATA